MAKHMEITQQDTFDTLKYGYIPMNELMEYAKTQNFDLSNFEYDDIEERYSYGQNFELLWDGDYYYIDCFIQNPNSEFDNTTMVTVDFVFGLNLMREEQRYFPPIKDFQYSFEIKSRSQFIEVLDKWEEYVQTCYGIILSHRIEILEDIDKIVKSEKAVFVEYDDKKIYSMKKSKKSEYKKWLKEMPLNMSNNIQKIINFQSIETEQINYDPIYISDGVWFNPITNSYYEV